MRPSPPETACLADSEHDRNLLEATHSQEAERPEKANLRTREHFRHWIRQLREHHHPNKHYPPSPKQAEARLQRLPLPLRRPDCHRQRREKLQCHHSYCPEHLVPLLTHKPRRAYRTDFKYWTTVMLPIVLSRGRCVKRRVRLHRTAYIASISRVPSTRSLYLAYSSHVFIPTRNNLNPIPSSSRRSLCTLNMAKVNVSIQYCGG